MTAQTAPLDDAPHLAFRPEAFFLKPWRGWGVVRDIFGRPHIRYTAEGQGRSDADSVLAEQVFTFDNGFVRQAEWEIVRLDERRYRAYDLRTGVEARGEVKGDSFRWSFLSRGATPFGEKKVRTEALFTQASPMAAFSFAKVSWLGLRLTTFTTFYEQV